MMENCHDQASADNAESLLPKGSGAKAQRKRVERVSWNRICCQVWRDITAVTDPDAELMAAIDTFRRRQLAKIDAQLAEFGIEPPARQAEEQNYIISGSASWASRVADQRSWASSSSTSARRRP
jgi:hypothetical protein